MPPNCQPPTPDCSWSTCRKNCCRKSSILPRSFATFASCSTAHNCCKCPLRRRNSIRAGSVPPYRNCAAIAGAARQNRIQLLRHDAVVEQFQRAARTKIVVTGIEAHVCVLHTALDLLALDFRVYIPVDAVASRYRLDQDMALRRFEKAGAILTTSEAAYSNGSAAPGIRSSRRSAIWSRNA